MNSSFFGGLGLGLAILIVVLAIQPRAKPPVHAGTPASTGLPSAEPAKDRSGDLTEARRESAELRDQVAKSKARIDHLEGTIRKFGEENKDLKDKVESALESEEQKAKNAAIRAEAILKHKVMVGKELPEEIVAALELDAGQKQALNQLFVQEGPKMYDMVRAVAAEIGVKQLPAENGLQLVIATLGPTLEKEQTKLHEMMTKPDAMSKTQYLEEFLGTDSAIFKITERGRLLRQETLAAAAITLTEAQREKLARFMAYNLNFAGAGFSFPENFEIRRK